MPEISLQRKAKGERPVYFADPAIDKVLSITLALAGEVAVMRDRLDTIERLLERGSLPTRKSIEEFVPDTEVRAQRETWRDTFLEVIMRSVQQEREGLDAKSSESKYATAIESVEAT